MLIAGRAIQALGACAASVLARAIARDLYHGPELTRALALVMIAMAAAPGFSPALGTGMTLAFGWRSTFVLVAVAGALVALHYRLSAGETLPPDRRRPARPRAIARTYAELAVDPRFIFPALTVSLVIGCLYSFFGAAPAILMAGMGLSATGLSIFFAATVLVVFGSGLMTAPAGPAMGRAAGRHGGHPDRAGGRAVAGRSKAARRRRRRSWRRSRCSWRAWDSSIRRHGDRARAVRRPGGHGVGAARFPADGMRRIGTA